MAPRRKEFGRHVASLAQLLQSRVAPQQGDHGSGLPRSSSVECQWPVGSARWRTVELPSSGQQNCPVAARCSARSSVGQWRHSLSDGGLGESDTAASGHDDVGVVLQAALIVAERERCDAVVSVGDFWLQDCSWDTPRRTHLEGHPSMSGAPLMRIAMRAPVPVVVDGNHEVWLCLIDYAQRVDVIQARAAGWPLHLGGTLVSWPATVSYSRRSSSSSSRSAINSRACRSSIPFRTRRSSAAVTGHSNGTSAESS